MQESIGDLDTIPPPPDPLCVEEISEDLASLKASLGTDEVKATIPHLT